MLTILFSTDNHLGYLEHDPIRGEDSFVVFEEILEIARERKVDMMILGGDLFHDNKPSRRTMYKTLGLLRKYCLGSRTSQLEHLSHPKTNLTSGFSVNYQDGNYNVSMPVFAIHGNHDDPCGEEQLCALDIPDMAGLLNLFGKTKDVDDIIMTPILLQRGKVRLALYGLGSIKDERLYRSIQRNKLRVFRPEEYTQEWFNLLVVHQNRTSHTPTGFLPEGFIDPFFHLVFWGHEHECLADETYQSTRGFYICQPGSSIATALTEGEARPKKVVILTLEENHQFSMEAVPLRQARSLLLQNVVLSNYPELNGCNESELEQFLWHLVDRAIAAHSDTLKPLVRFRIDYSGEHNPINASRFGQGFVDRVANPKTMLHFHRKRLPKVVDPRAPDDRMEFEELVAQFLSTHKLELLSPTEFGNAVKLFVDKDDRHAIESFISRSLSQF